MVKAKTLRFGIEALAITALVAGVTAAVVTFAVTKVMQYSPPKVELVGCK